MLALVLLATLASPPNQSCVVDLPPRTHRIAADSLQEIYEKGRSFAEFLASVERRKELWHANYEAGAAIDVTLVKRAQAVGGKWRVLVVAIDSCADSASTIPYLARLIEQVDGMEMHVVLPGVGRSVQEAHRTPDGRAATPTVLLLSPDWKVAGCFVERPVALREWMEAHTGENKLDWYASDRGQTTVAQFVDVMEQAKRGAIRCE